MKAALARIITYGSVAILVAGALYGTPKLPESRPAEAVLTASPTQSGSPRAFSHRVDTLGSGESLRSVFARGGVSEVLVNQALRTLTVIDPGRVRAGMPVTFSASHPDSAPTEIVLQLGIDRLLHLERSGMTWVEREENVPWTTDTIVVAGTIGATLYQAMDSSAKDLLTAAARQQLTWSLADVFEYKIDMSRDLQAGDAFRVMAERATSRTGAVRIGRILAATFILSGTELQAVRYKSNAVSGDYFDADGKSLRAAFLRAPLEFRRISSRFGGRMHPVLGVWKEHRGTDYAASQGTPVRAIGDGVVIRAGWGNGYGNVLELRHRNGYVTRYGHLRGFASAVRVGTRVTIGQTVAYVGSTGMSTGPHLHFEVLVDGMQRDPRVALRNRGGEPVPARERAEFELLRTRMIASLQAGSPAESVGLALR